MTLYFIIAILMLLIGIAAGVLGLLISADPEGRGGILRLLFPLGVIVVMIAVVWLLLLLWEVVRVWL
ncbi:MAG: hypothetical protein HY849_00205 [Nitrosomonadales bacterium]|nr:hypothetical protein [Nitrosomonadales bacterium]